MKSTTVYKALLLIVLLFIGNRVFNHHSAWGGILLVAALIGVTAYYIYRHIKNNQSKSQQ